MIIYFKKRKNNQDHSLFLANIRILLDKLLHFKVKLIRILVSLDNLKDKIMNRLKNNVNHNLKIKVIIILMQEQRKYLKANSSYK